MTGHTGRQCAHNVLSDKIVRKDKDTEALRILLRVIPWDTLGDQEEELLWSYFVRRPDA